MYRVFHFRHFCGVFHIFISIEGCGVRDSMPFFCEIVDGGYKVELKSITSKTPFYLLKNSKRTFTEFI